MTDLTDRQRKVKALLEQGKGAREIAEITGTSRNAVYQIIQRGRRHGWLPHGFTASGLPPREQQPGQEMLANLLLDTNDKQVEAAGTLALVNELRRTRDSLDELSRRLSSIVPR